MKGIHMKTVELGLCCSHCFVALNCRMSEIPEHEKAMVKQSSHALSKLADDRDVSGLCTSNEPQIGHDTCCACEKAKSGAWWPLYGTLVRKDH